MSETAAGQPEPHPPADAGEQDAAVAQSPPVLKAAAIPIGSGAFKAVVESNGERLWVCSHIHFTDHSAKACAERHIRSMTSSG